VKGRPPRRRRPAPGAIAASAVALVLFAAFVALAILSRPNSALSAWDARVGEAFAGWRTSGRSHLFWALTLIGNDAVLAALSVAAVVLLAAWGRRARAALVGVGLLLGWGISEAAKAVVGRERPPVSGALIALPSSHSMPSGHAFSTLVFISLLTYVAWLALRGPVARPGRGASVAVGIVAAVVIGLIGVSRVYLGVHWFSDVIGGWCLGGAWVAAYVGLLWRGIRGVVPSEGARARPPAPIWVRVALVAVLLAACALAIVLSVSGDPLLTNV
jgi:membrane-associated phospholipid phosphatase